MGRGVGSSAEMLAFRGSHGRCLHIVDMQMESVVLSGLRI